MKTPALALLLLAACGGTDTPATPPTPKLSVEVFPAKESDVNAYVLSDGTGTILLDATRNSAEARELLAVARAHGGDPALVFVTHGHPDHYLGLGALRAEIPGLRVVVASEAIKNDILGFSTFMEGAGWLEGEPGMKPAAFDYASIEVLADTALRTPGGAVLEVKSDYAPAEAEHTATLYSKDLDALFTGDLAYHDVHLWLGVGVSHAHAAAWKDTTLALERAYPTATIYPGHGAPTDRGVFAAVRAYIDDLLAIAAASDSDEAAIAAMVEKYPDHRNREFLLLMSVQNQRQLAGAK